ncbi:MAG: hypothetical protein ACXADD_18605 [Candidatus Thorarchaeota archaeon]|jgi:hypothetical protein
MIEPYGIKKLVWEFDEAIHIFGGVIVDGGYLKDRDIIGDGAIYTNENKTLFPYLPILDWDLLAPK